MKLIENPRVVFGKAPGTSSGCTPAARESSIPLAGAQVSLVYIHLSRHPFAYSYGALALDSSSLSLISALIFKTPNEMNIKHSNRFNSSPMIMFGPRRGDTRMLSPPEANLYAEFLYDCARSLNYQRAR